MINYLIEFFLILLLIFTPIAFGAMDLWAVSLMELAILFIMILWAVQFGIISKLQIPDSKLQPPGPGLRTPHSCTGGVTPPLLGTPHLILLLLFLCLILFQMVPFPSAIVRTVSPKTYELRHFLFKGFPSDSSDLNSGASISSEESSTRSSALSFEPLTNKFPLSFVPFATLIQFFKWLTLMGLFIFLQLWDPLGREGRRMSHFILVIFLVGVFESLYGMFEVFSGHNQVLYLKLEGSSVAGTFTNRNIFAGYLLMVIPLSIGFLLSREDLVKFHGWRHRLGSLDGKTVLIGFGAIVMILGLFFSASRMGIMSLLLSFSFITFLFRSLSGGKRISRIPIFILALAILWAAWIGLDAVIGRFFTTSEGFEDRWGVWADTFKILKDFPFFGTGLGTFWQVFPMYRSFHVIGLTEHAENDFLQLASEVGLVGAGFLLILFFSFFYKTVSGIHSLSWRDPARYIGMGGLVGILALMFHSLVEKNIQNPANAFLFIFIFALVLNIGGRARKNAN